MMFRETYRRFLDEETALKIPRFRELGIVDRDKLPMLLLKSAVIAMASIIARDQLGIRCNTIVRGLIRTPLFQNLPDNIVRALDTNVSNPGRLGKPGQKWPFWLKK